MRYEFDIWCYDSYSRRSNPSLPPSSLSRGHSRLHFTPKISRTNQPDAFKRDFSRGRAHHFSLFPQEIALSPTEHIHTQISPNSQSSFDFKLPCTLHHLTTFKSKSFCHNYPSSLANSGVTVLEARLEQADLLKKVRTRRFTTSIYCTNLSRSSMPSKILSRTVTSTAMTPVSPSKPWTTPTLRSSR